MTELSRRRRVLVLGRAGELVFYQPI